MSGYLGNFIEDATVEMPFTTHSGSGGAVAPSSAFEAADVKIYKGASATQKTSTNGVTMTSPFDSITGLHLLVIDTSVDTGDSGFWEAGNDYWAVLDPDETVDGESVVRVIGRFSIENRFSDVIAINGSKAAAGKAETFWESAITSGAVNDGSASTTAFITNLTETTNDHFNGASLVMTSGALTNQVRKIDDYDGSTKTITVTPAFTEAPANTDTFMIIGRLG